jgi:hypothetical protein
MKKAESRQGRRNLRLFGLFHIFTHYTDNMDVKTGISGLLAACLLLILPMGAAAQDDPRQGIPADVYYLLPAFSQGMVYLAGQGPAQGQLNICAEDQTLRFMDNGVELSSNADNIVKVQVDTAVFVRSDGFFYRIYQVPGDTWIAYLRKVEILRDVKKGAYGMESRISSIRTAGSFSSDGVMYTLEQAANYPYNVTETCFLYRDGQVIPFNKRNLRKCYPDRKDDLEAYFKSGHSLPESLEDTRSFLIRLSSGADL